MTQIAVIQHAPVMLAREACISKAIGLIAEVAAQGAQLVIFPEAFIGGYPAWIWRMRPGNDWGSYEAIHARMLDNAVEITRGDLQPLQDAAREHGVVVVCGMNERDTEFSRATLYNSCVVIGDDGQLLNCHRKLMPTNPERMVWGFGDATGLRVIDTPLGRIGTLICWENYMPLARFALYAQGVDIYIAPTYDSGDDWQQSLQHIAREGGCWTISAGVQLNASDMPEDLPNIDQLYPDKQENINPGDSVIVAPDGSTLAGPLHAQSGVLMADIDVDQAARSRRTRDVAGHYARPDIFTLQINEQAQQPLRWVK